MADKDKPRKRRTLSLPGIGKDKPLQEELALEGVNGDGEKTKSAPIKKKRVSKPKSVKPNSPKSKRLSKVERLAKEEAEAMAEAEAIKQAEADALEQIALKEREAEAARVKADIDRAAKADAMTAPVAISALQKKQSGSLPVLKINDFAERMPYVILILLGFFLIVVSKTLTNIPSWIVTGAAVSIIIGYGVFAGIRQQNRMRIDRIGDNCYYLGLTYTLASLISALFGLTGEDVGQRLLEDFGIALGSTAAGVIMRMVLMQFREEIDDIETDARLTLTQEAKEFEAQLRRARQDLDDYKHTVIASVSDTHTELAEMLKVQAVNLRDKNMGTADSLDDRMAAMDSFLEAFTLRSDALLKTAEMLGGATQSLASRMDNIKADPETLENAFTAIGKGLEASESSLTKTAESLERTSKSIDSRNEGADKFMALSERLETRIEALDGTLEKMTENMQRQLEAVEKGSKVMDAHVAAMKTYTDAAELEGERMRKATATVYESLGSLASTVTREAGRGL